MTVYINHLLTLTLGGGGAYLMLLTAGIPEATKGLGEPAQPVDLPEYTGKSTGLTNSFSSLIDD